MLHHSPAKKNKHQNDYEAYSELYLYDDYKTPKNGSNHHSLEIVADLDGDIFYMRRHFKRTVKKLKRTMYYDNWLKNVREGDRTNERARLRARSA